MTYLKRLSPMNEHRKPGSVLVYSFIYSLTIYHVPSRMQDLEVQQWTVQIMPNVQVGSWFNITNNRFTRYHRPVPESTKGKTQPPPQGINCRGRQNISAKDKWNILWRNKRSSDQGSEQKSSHMNWPLPWPRQGKDFIGIYLLMAHISHPVGDGSRIRQG